MSHKLSRAVSSISTLIDRHVDKQAPNGEDYMSLNREDKAVFTHIRNEQYHVHLSKRDTVQAKIPQGYSKDGTPTCHDK